MAWHSFSGISRSGTNRHNFTGDVEVECNAWDEGVRVAKSSIAIVKRKDAKSDQDLVKKTKLLQIVVQKTQKNTLLCILLAN